MLEVSAAPGRPKAKKYRVRCKRTEKPRNLPERSRSCCIRAGAWRAGLRRPGKPNGGIEEFSSTKL
jgi:hypothetical protein